MLDAKVPRQNHFVGQEATLHVDSADEGSSLIYSFRVDHLAKFKTLSDLCPLIFIPKFFDLGEVFFLE